MDGKLIKDIHRAWGSMRRDGSYPPFLPAAQPVSLERKNISNLFRKRYFVSEKNDGIRMCFLYIGNTCGFVDRKMKLIEPEFAVPFKFSKGTILDGEMMPNGQYIVYDAIMVCGRNVRHMNFLERLDIAKTNISGVPFRLKKFYKMDDIKTCVDYMSDHNDGLIFTPIDDPVCVATQYTMFKWKPLEKITIDFMVKGRKMYVQDRGSPVLIGSEDWCSTFWDGTIVECSYADSRWKPLKVRTDKDYANSVRTYDKTLLNIHENIKIEDIMK